MPSRQLNSKSVRHARDCSRLRAKICDDEVLEADIICGTCRMLRFFTSAVCCLAVVVLAGCGGGSSGSAPISVGGPPVLYVTTSSNTIASFQISSAGVLTP